MGFGDHQHEIGIDLEARKFVCIGCSRIFNADVASGMLERSHGLERWRRLNRVMSLWKHRYSEGERIEPPVQTLEAAEGIMRI